MAEIYPSVTVVAKVGRMDTLAEKMLRNAGKSLTARELAERMLSALPGSPTPRPTIGAMESCAYSYLRAKRLRGEVRVSFVPGQKAQSWELIDPEATE
jgi:hypothetical protein